MRATRRLSGRRFLLLDDVVTTGSTLVEAARALRSAGAEVVGCVTLAYTPRRWLGVSPETAQFE
jgi:predicted amidophosphoribosyltransferase